MSMRERQEVQEVLRGLKTDSEETSKQNLIRVAGIQFSATGGRDINVKRALHFARVACEKKADVICFSELFSLPWFTADDTTYMDYAEEIPGPSTQPFFELAREFNTVFLCPFYEKAQNHRFNSVAVIGPSGLIGCCRKVHIPNLAYWEEGKYFQASEDGFLVFDIGKAKIGIQTGWDVFFPEGARLLALQGAEIIFSPTAAAFDSQSRWQTVITSHAICNNIFVFRVNRVGKDGDLDFYGKSFCADPFGELAAKPAFHRDAIVLADLDLNAIKIARNEFPFLKQRQVDLFSGLLEK